MLTLLVATMIVRELLSFQLACLGTYTSQAVGARLYGECDSF